jgi:cell division protease FtsH
LLKWLRWAPFPLLILVNFLLFPVLIPGRPQRVEVSYTFFKRQVEMGNVVEISTRADTIQGTFKQPVAYPPDAGSAAKTAADFSTVVPAFADAGLEILLHANGGVINARPIEEPRNPLLTVLLGFGPTLLLIAGFVWFSRRAAGQMAGGAFGLGKSKAKRYDQTTVGERGVTFADFPRKSYLARIPPVPRTTCSRQRISPARW